MLAASSSGQSESSPPAGPARNERVAGALLGTFVGDALGMPFEGLPPAGIPDQIEMREARLGRGTYTDDTEMMIGLAESLCERRCLDSDHVARRWLDGFDARRGYGGGTLRVFELWRRGVSPHVASRVVFGGDGSLGNGAAMRIAPLAAHFAKDPERLIWEARRSAEVTHSHPLGIDAAVVQAAAIGAAVRRDQVLSTASDAAHTDELRRRLERVEALLVSASTPSPSEVADELGNSSAGHESVPAAIYAVCEHESFQSAVSFAIRCGGDTDTIAAMAGAVAGAWGGSRSIPSRWLEALEDGPRGRSHVEELATQLARLEPMPKAPGSGPSRNVRVVTPRRYPGRDGND